MLHVDTADAQLDGKATVTEGLLVRLAQECSEDIADSIP
jgi:hypothetical protein